MPAHRFLPVIAALFLLLTNFVFASRPGWTSKKVNMRAPGGQRITAIHHPKDKEVKTRGQKKSRPRRIRMHKDRLTTKSMRGSVDSVSDEPSRVSTGSVMVNTIDSPPVNGFIPWIAVSATDERKDDSDYYSQPEYSVVGNYFPVNEHTDFAIGLFDTGASAHVIGYESSQILNFGEDLDTGNYTEISGVTGSVFTWVSQPLSIFIAGLNAIDTSVNPMLLDTDKLVGQSNISVAVGNVPEPNAPDLPTAIGSPMSLFYTTVIDNDQPITVHFNGINYTAPNIELYPSGTESQNIPDYSIKIPLELRPGGVLGVSYIPSFDLGGSLDFPPSSPSVIVGNSSQSLYFVHAVDLYENDKSGYDKDGFMIDTGAQVSVIGNRIAARLAIDPDEPEFIVDIEGVSGEVSQIGGYYIDRIEIPALGEWLTFTDVPVILLDIASPEGGTLDGIIGMNLFNEYNMVFSGGGMFLQDAPSLDLELITSPPTKLAGDIAPAIVDGVVDSQDIAVFMQAWLTEYGDANFNSLCDIAPESVSDGKVNLLDFAILASNWLKDLSGS